MLRELGSSHRKVVASSAALAAAVCLLIYYYGLRAAYQMDDFVWLGQVQRVHSFSDFWFALVHPAAHGTWRPLSERLPFLVLGWLFGDNALPFRLLVFGTAIAEATMLASVVHRLSGSPMAAMLAPVLWFANCAIAFPMAWSSSLMHFLCGFCLLLAFHFLIRFVETEKWRYYWLQVSVFIVSLGVMETTVVYPAIATLYVLFFARKYLRNIIPLFTVSVAFLAFHMWYAPKVSGGPYAPHFDLGMAGTLWTYWSWALFPPELGVFFPRYSAWFWGALIAAGSAALLGSVAYRSWRRDFVPLFFLGAFVILLGPVLPLSGHLQLYYLTLPSTAFAALAAVSLAWAWRTGWLSRGLGVALALSYCGFQATSARAINKWWYERGERIELVVRGVKDARKANPGKAIVLTGVDDEIFTGAVRDRAFDAVGVADVFLEPRTADALPVGIAAPPKDFRIDEADLVALLDDDKAIVLDVAGGQTRDVTGKYLETAAQLGATLRPPATVRVASPGSAQWLGEGWYAAESGFRWMSARALLKLAGPANASQKLYIHGHCQPEQTAKGAVVLKVSMGGRMLKPFSVSQPGFFDASFDIPKSFVGAPEIDLELTVDRTMNAPGDSRTLGLAITEIEFH